MKKVLAPIVHKDAYTRAVEKHVDAYFDETVFGPLFEILFETGVMKSSRANAVEDWEVFPREFPSLGIRRSVMPQIASEDRAELVSFLAALGIRSVTKTVKASRLLPSQREFSPVKVAIAQELVDLRRPILISSDDRVIDGHHQWWAKLTSDPAAKIDVVQLLELAPALINHVRMFTQATRENALGSPRSALYDALQTGRVWYAEGVFTGSFSPAVAKELRELGASFELRAPGRVVDVGTHVFRLSSDKLPPDLRIAATSSLDRAREAHRQVDAFLVEAQKNFLAAPTGINVDRAVERITTDLQRQFMASVRGLDFIEISAHVTPGMRDAMTRELTENLDLYVKNFLTTEIPELRRMVEQNAFAGYRADRMAQIIQARYGVTKRKAAFLAEQETSLLVATYREQQAASVGAISYKWSTSHDERVRKDHKLLNGQVCYYATPPITNRKTGARNNPGKDFRCRCVDMPIIEIPAENAKAPQRKPNVIDCSPMRP